MGQQRTKTEDINLDTNSLNINPKLAVDFNNRARIPFRFDNECVALIFTTRFYGFCFFCYTPSALSTYLSNAWCDNCQGSMYFDKMGGGITEATPSNIFTLETKFKVFESFFYILCCVVNLNEML